MYEYVQTEKGWVLCWGPLPQETVTPAKGPVVEPATPSTLAEITLTSVPTVPVKEPAPARSDLSV